MPSTDEKINELQTKLAQLKNRKQAVDARLKSKTAGEKRRLETRQKILAGSFLIEKFGTTELANLRLKDQTFEAWLTRDSDRSAFGLQSKNEAA
jgi:hypothetical protein